MLSGSVSMTNPFKQQTGVQILSIKFTYDTSLLILYLLCTLGAAGNFLPAWMKSSHPHHSCICECPCRRRPKRLSALLGTLWLGSTQVPGRECECRPAVQMPRCSATIQNWNMQLQSPVWSSPVLSIPENDVNNAERIILAYTGPEAKHLMWSCAKK